MAATSEPGAEAAEESTKRAAERWIRREVDALIECLDLWARGSDLFPAGSAMSGVFREKIALQACQATFFLFVSQNELAEFEESSQENGVPASESTTPLSPQTPATPAELAGEEKWIASDVSRKVLEWI